jgi:hypothetical protein
MHCHSEPVGRFLPSHFLDPLYASAHVSPTPHWRQGTKGKPESEGKILLQFSARLVSAAQSGQIYSRRSELPENSVLDQREISSGKAPDVTRLSQTG